VATAPRASGEISFSNANCLFFLETVMIRSSLFNRRESLACRRGLIFVLAAFLMIVVIGMVAFGVDIGYIVLTRTELQKAIDATAFAAGAQLVNGTAAAQTEGLKYLALNPVGGRTLGATDANFEFGSWDPTTRTFTVSNVDPTAVRVTGNDTNQPLFFARIFGKTSFNASAAAVAVFKPRDIALVLDYTGSMAYDSEFRNIGLLGQPAIEASLQQIYTELGSPKYGTLTFKPVAYGNSSTNTNKVKKNFGLDKVAYPYPAGSWDEYVTFVQTDSYTASAGYQNAYGYMTWINYLLSKHCGVNDTPVLWKTSEHPLSELKDAVDEFLAYLTAHCTSDQVSLSIYTYSDGTAVLEQALTKDYTKISPIIRQRQAGHYIGGTNMSAGMTKGRADLQKNGRPNALRMMVLMTDGIVNLPNGNSAKDKQLCIDEANLCAAANIPIVTISVGALADVALMQQIADITKGSAFVVHGGQSVAAVKAQLEAVFAKVAADRPLQLVQ
jgi:Flp pilus assembly protein TadG